jgi:diacylglycerol kinase (ATP)
MSYAGKHIALVCNPTPQNKKALRVADSISVLLAGMDIRHSIFSHVWPQAWDTITEVWIIGGDGTVNHFINQYSAIQLPLAVFAGGTGNDFHWMLYGEIDMEQQVEKILDADPKFIDAGVCNGKLFLNGIGIGFDGAIVHDLQGKKKSAGKTSYLLSILKNVLWWREKHCTIELHDQEIEQDCFMISVANAKRYGGGFHVAPKATIDDGLLDVSIIGRIPPIKRIKYLPIVEKGKHLDQPFVRYEHVDKIKIISRVKIHAHMDGEYLHDEVFDIEVLPKRFSFLF